MRDFHNQDIPHISQVTLRVNSIEKSTKFYQNLLGLEVTSSTNEQVVLSSDFGDVLTLEQATMPYSFTEGLYHVAYILPSIEALGKWFMYQREIGTKIYGASDHLVSYAFYLTDPDGNGVEVYADTDDTTWKYESYGIAMDTLPLNIQKVVGNIKAPETLDNNVRVGHVHLKARNILEMAHFYQELLFDVTLDMGSAMFMSFDQYHHHLAINSWNKASMELHNEDSVDIKELVIMYPTQKYRDDIVSKLENEKVNILLEEEDIIVVDPIGIRVRLMV